MANTFIEGRKVILRTLDPKDAKGPYAKWFNNAETCKHNSHHAFPYYKGDAQSYIESINRSRKDLVLAITDKKNGSHIGNIALQKIDYISRNAEFAIILGNANYRGKGFAKEAAHLLVSHGFSVLNLNRIYCGTSNNNMAMKKLAESLGMKREGMRRKALYKAGRYVDIAEYGLLKNEYKGMA